MYQTKSVQLSTNELAASLALCGYENMASEIIINLENSTNDEETISRFIQYTESTLKGKGYLDETRPKLLTSELEELLHLLMTCKRKVRCVKNHQVLFIHFAEKETVIIQEIKNSVHNFSEQKISQGFEYNLRKHYGLPTTNNNYPMERKTMLLSEELYNELHILNPQYLEDMINDKKVDIDLREFLTEFKQNNQQFDNLTFMEMDYIRDQMDLKEVIFLLPSKRNIWHLDYDNIMKEEVYVIPFSIDDYLIQLNQRIIKFFDIKYSPIS